jgi:hypothetical protein
MQLGFRARLTRHQQSTYTVWRRRVPLRDLEEMTVLRPLGLQIVLLERRFAPSARCFTRVRRV